MSDNDLLKNVYIYIYLSICVVCAPSQHLVKGGQKKASNTLELNRGGSLTKNGTYCLIILNAWSALGGTVWKGLEGVILLEEVCHWLWAFKF